MENKYLTVSAVNKYIKYRFDNDASLKNIFIKAEISNVRKSKGFLYFILKDEESEMPAMMFPNNIARLKIDVVDGMQVIVLGSVEAYVKRGNYMFIANTIEEVGMGQAYLDFLRLKEKLAKEGLFEDKYKKKIPLYAERIGVITSATGDAINDIIFTFNNRFPLAKIYLYPALVQGQDAPASLIKALNKANKDNLVDLIIIGRGGGSLEDLSCFNDEGLARAIFASRIPIISAVGHEADYSICDFVADLRAPTPTGAAMLASISKEDIYANLYNINKHLSTSIKNTLSDKYYKLDLLNNSYVLSRFGDLIDKKRLELDAISVRLNSASPINKLSEYIKLADSLSLRLGLLSLDTKINEKIDYINKINLNLNKNLSLLVEKNDKEIEGVINKLILLNPLNVLAKGYSLTYLDSKLVKSINDVKENDEINIKVSDGTIDAYVKRVKDGRK
ncbi:MAG: exodeoxyribonuclease VII large subunit [Bacilli bacterium]|nr:exodeoxyribonuclease VII large subunit [Bacilli bacterium]